MSSFSVIASLPNKEQAEAVGKAMERFVPQPIGVGVCEIDEISGDWEVSGLFLKKPDPIKLHILEVYFSLKFLISNIPDHDWIDKVNRDLKPVIEPPYMISGSYYSSEIPNNKKAIIIEAAMAFGTGHHSTTIGCLRALNFLNKIGVFPKRVADVGCGTGILAIACSKTFGAKVIASDIDYIATQTARKNIKANGSALSVLALEAKGLNHYLINSSKNFDLVLANILAKPLKRMALEIKENVKIGGHIVLSGILVKQINSVEAIYFSLGFRRVKKIKIGEWACVVMKNFCRSKKKNKL